MNIEIRGNLGPVAFVELVHNSAGGGGRQKGNNSTSRTDLVFNRFRSRWRALKRCVQISTDV